MDKTFNPSAIESRWYEQWEQNGFFKPNEGDESYSIVIPPPNVTGSLHMGHAFQHTIMDSLIRYQRMKGKSTLWQVGTDHAGIATQMVVERKIGAEESKTRHDYGRDAFIEKIWQWKAESGGTITQQMRRLGNSVDWDRERFTMDENLSKAVSEVFVQLYEDGLIYRGKRLVNWDPKLHTAISDLEVENHDRNGSLWHFRYPLADGAKTADGKDYLVVATTRPETMLGDTAVAVHPEDERYAQLVGKEAILPLVNRRIPIVSDDYVDREFGTGCVKITPAHDFNDYAVGQRHKLPMINIFDQSASILTSFQCFNSDGSENSDLDNHIPESYQGLDRESARKQVNLDLEKLGLMDSIKDHPLKVPMGDRSGVVIEPLLTDQWYVGVQPLADRAIKAVEDGDIEFVPKSYENMYFAWMRNIQDWCISRQLWWGHRIPAWYDNAGNVYVGRTEAEVREAHGLDGRDLRQDDDVLDTWFSSALWTFSTMGWPDSTDDLRRFHPTDVLVTGFDIIFFWVARMIMMALHFTNQVPFKTVYVTGLIRDESGQKMSKSKGNVLDPLDMIDGIELKDLLEKRTSNLMQPRLAEKISKQTQKQFPDGIQPYGTDALRFTLAALASTGRDINWDMNRLEGYRNFCNKLWNASRYVLMNTEEQDCGQDGSSDYQLTTADRWIISRLQEAEKSVSHALDTYRLDLCASAIYEFVWHDYCDWYLELSKPVLWDDDSPSELKKGTRRTLIRVLESILRMAHPIIPFITEEIWQSVKGLAGTEGETIMLANYPLSDAEIDQDSIAAISWLQSVIVGVRNIRGEMNISPGKSLPLYLKGGNANQRDWLQNNQQMVSKLANLESISWLESSEKAPTSATSLTGNTELFVPMAGVIDVEAEIARLDKELEKLAADLNRIEQKLNNANFVERAPASVVEVERDRYEAAKTALEKLTVQREEINNLS